MQSTWVQYWTPEWKCGRRAYRFPLRAEGCETRVVSGYACHGFCGSAVFPTVTGVGHVSSPAPAKGRYCETCRVSRSVTRPVTLACGGAPGGKRVFDLQVILACQCR